MDEVREAASFELFLPFPSLSWEFILSGKSMLMSETKAERWLGKDEPGAMAML